MGLHARPGLSIPMGSLALQVCGLCQVFDIAEPLSTNMPIATKALVARVSIGKSTRT